MSDDLKIRMPEWARNMYNRLLAKIDAGGGGGGGDVTGVKGDAESSYRTGQVNLTAANIGAVATSDIANDLTTTAAGKVLDARQGKVLKDMIDHVKKTIYVGSGTYRNDIGVALPLTIPDTFSYAYITVMAFESEIVGANRRIIMIPEPGHANVNAAYYPYAYSSGTGAARIDIFNNELMIISATASSLYVGAVYAHY